MMENHGRPQQLQFHPDIRYASPSSSPFIDNESCCSASSSAVMMSPLSTTTTTMMCSSRQQQEAVNNNIHHYHGGVVASSVLPQWPGGQNNNSSSWDHTTPMTNNSKQCHHQDVGRPAVHSMNDHDGHYSSNHHHHPPSTNQGTIKQKPTKDRFLYTLYNILSSPSTTYEESSITWLPHGQGFILLNKPMFESDILKRILPNVKYASFVKRLKRYKFVRISSGSELGAYYHPYFRRDQPHLLPLINTIDEIPMERYGVNVNDVVTFGGASSVGSTKSNNCATTSSSCNVDGGGGGNIIAPSRTVTASSFHDHDPLASNLEEDDFVPIATTFRPILETTGDNNDEDGDSIYSDSLSLGSITPNVEDLSVGPSFFEELLNGDGDDDVKIDIDDNDEDDDVFFNLKSIGGGGGDGGSVVAPISSAANTASESREVVATKDTSLQGITTLASMLNKNILEVQQQLLRQETVLQFESEQQQQVITVQSPAVATPTTTFSEVTSQPTGSNPNSNNHSAGNSGKYVEDDMKCFPDMLRQISKAKRLESMTQHQNRNQIQMPSSSTSPVTSMFSTLSSTTLTANVPTDTSIIGGGGHDMKKSFQYCGMGSAPEHLATMRKNTTRKYQYRRIGSTHTTIVAPREKDCANSMTFQRKDSNTSCYTVEDRSAKYRYPSSTKTFGFEHHYRRKRNVPMTSATFGQQLGEQQQQHPEEVQPYFVSLDWSQHSAPDESLLNLNTSYSGLYKPLADHHHHHCSQPQQEPQLLMLPPSPPAFPQSHQNAHNNLQQLAEKILDNVQQVKTLLLNQQQQYHGECGRGSSDNLELSDDHAYSYGNSSGNFGHSFPLQPEEQFPSYSRRSTL